MLTPLYNQITEYSITNSPYFTEEIIDNACYNCANEIGAPAVFSSQCDICKTLTVSTVKQLDFMDLWAIATPIIIIFIMIFLFRKKRQNKSRL